MNTILLISTSILAFTGFSFAFYGTLSQAMIDNITNKGIDKGISFDTDDGAKYYARRYKKWSAGSFFSSQKAITNGKLIVLVALIFNLVGNPWWSSLIVLLSGYILYFVIAKIIGWRIQLLSILFFLPALLYTAFLIM